MNTPPKYNKTLATVANRGRPPGAFLDQLVAWGRSAPEVIFAPNKVAQDIYVWVRPELGPWDPQEPLHRRAVMLECLRVLAGFEASWNWSEGRDLAASNTSAETTEAGIFQVSYNSRNFGQDLRDLLRDKSVSNGASFQLAMKEDHALAIEYAARLLRLTVRHNGPVLRKEINPYLSRASVSEFLALLRS